MIQFRKKLALLCAFGFLFVHLQGSVALAQESTSSVPDSHSCDSATCVNGTNPATATIVESASHSTPINLDLSSTQQTVALPTTATFLPFNLSVTDGSSLPIQPGALLTPAQFIAAFQILSGGTQELLLGINGNAVGGSFAINETLSQPLGNLVVPQGVTAIHDFGVASELNLAGILSNAGTFYAVSSNMAVNSAAISSSSIINQQGALITSVLPTAGLPGYSNLLSSLNLNVSAIQEILNHGTISSSANLLMSAGGSIANTGSITAAQNAVLNAVMGNINNSGLIAASTGNLHLSAGGSILNTANILAGHNAALMSIIGSIANSGLVAADSGNINLTSELGRSLAVNNIEGTLRALNAQINIENIFNDEASIISLAGGDLLSQELNLSAGAGKVNLAAGNVSGVVNIDAACANLSVSGPSLNLGRLNITGDPTFYNSGGSVVLNNPGTFQVNANLAVVASQDIIINGPSGEGIITNPGAGQAGDVYLFAGANFTAPLPLQNLQSGPDFATTITLQGGSTTGGAVYVPGGIRTNGGIVQIAAYSGNGSGSTLNPGSIQVGDVSTKGGGVAMISGATSGVGISTGNITTSTASGPKNGGNVGLLAVPFTSPSFSITNAVPSTFPAPFAPTSSTYNSALISTGNILTAGGGGNGGTDLSPIGQAGGSGGSVTIRSNGTINTGFVRTFGGGGGGGVGNNPGGVGGTGGTVLLDAGAGSVNVLGDINSSGGGGGGGGSFNTVALIYIAGGSGGSAGAVSISSNSVVSIAGAILAAGGGNGGSGKSTFLFGLGQAGGGGGSYGGGGGGGATGGGAQVPGGAGGGGLYGGGGGGGGGNGTVSAGGGGGGGFAGGGGGGGGAGGFQDAGTTPPPPEAGGGGGGGGLGIGGGGGGSTGANGAAGSGGGSGGDGLPGGGNLSSPGGSGGPGGGGSGGAGTVGNTVIVNGGAGGAGGGAGAGTGAGGAGGVNLGGSIPLGGGTPVPPVPDTNGAAAGWGGGGQVTISGHSLHVGQSNGTGSNLGSIRAEGPGGFINIQTSPTAKAVYFNDANYGPGAQLYASPLGGFGAEGPSVANQIVINGSVMGSQVAAGRYGGQAVNIRYSTNLTRQVSVANLLTPAEQIAVVQVLTGGLASQTIVLSDLLTRSAIGGNFTIDSSLIPSGGFTSLNLPSTVTANVNVPTLTYAGPATIDGFVSFSSGGAQLHVSNGNIAGSGRVIGSYALRISAGNGSIGASGNPLGVQARVLGLDAAGSGNVFALFMDNIQLELHNSTAAGQFNLYAPQTITSSPGTSISSPIVIIESGVAIGEQGAPLNINGTTQLTAKAGLSVYVRNISPTGTTTLAGANNMFGQAIVNRGTTYNLQSQGDIIAAGGASSLPESAVTAASVALNSTLGNVGSSTKPVLLGTAYTNLTAQAAQSVFVKNPLNGATSLSSSVLSDGSLITNKAGNTYSFESEGTIASLSVGTLADNSISAPRVIVTSNNGDVGLSYLPVLLSGQSGQTTLLTARALSAGGSVNIRALSPGLTVSLRDVFSGGFPLYDNGAGQTYSLQAASDIISSTAGAGSTITAPTTVLYSLAGNTGTAASPVMLSGTSNLTAQASQSVVIRDITNGNITLQGNVAADGTTITNKAGSTYNLQTVGDIVSSNIGTPANNAILASSIILYSTTGNVGTAASPVLLNALFAPLTAQASSTGKSVFINNILVPPPPGSLPFDASTTVILSNGVAAGGAAITNRAGSIYNIQAVGRIIAASQTVEITAPDVVLYSSTSDVGSSAASPIRISSPSNLTAKAAGSVFINNTATGPGTTVSLKSANSVDGTLIANSAAGQFNIAAQGNIVSSASGAANAISAPITILHSVAGSTGTATAPVLINGATTLTAQANQDVQISTADILQPFSISFGNAAVQSSSGNIISNKAGSLYRVFSNSDISLSSDLLVEAPLFQLQSQSGNLTTLNIRNSGQSIDMSANSGSISTGNIITAGIGGTAGNMAAAGGPGQNAGNISINALANINTGMLLAYGGGGGGGTTGGAGGSGGNVLIGSTGGSVITNAINSSGGGGGGSSAIGSAGGAGGSAGNITISVNHPNSVAIQGSVLAAGGGNGGSSTTAFGGAGGGGSFGGGGGGAAGTNAGGGGGGYGSGSGGNFFTAGGGGGSTAGNGAGGNGMPTGGSGGFFGMGGAAGNAVSSNGANVGSPVGSGNGGAISISALVVSITGTVAGLGAGTAYSSSAFTQDSLNALGAGGSIVIGTPSGQSYFADANYAAGAATYLAPAGRFVSVGSLQADQPIVINGVSFASPVAAGSFDTVGSILEGTQLVLITPGSFITPAEQIAFLQVLGGGPQTLLLGQPAATNTPGTGFASGGNFSINNQNVPSGDFNSLTLPAGVTAQVNVPTLTYTGQATVDGNINFSSASAQLNVGSSLNLGGTINFNGATSGAVLAGNTISGSGSVSSLSGLLSITSTAGNIGTSLTALAVSSGASGIMQLRLNANALTNAAGLGNVYIRSADADLSATLPALLLAGSSAGSGLPADNTTGNFEVTATSGGIGILGAVSATTGLTLSANTNLTQQAGGSFASKGLSLLARTGSVYIQSLSVNGGGISLMSGQDVIVAGGLATVPGAVQGDLTLVAGANFVNAFSINGASATGGTIFVTGPITTSGNNFTAAAYTGSGTGSAFLPGTVSVTGAINTGAVSGSQINGNAAIIAAGSSSAISVAGITTSSGAGSSPAAGSIHLFAATPVINGGTDLFTKAGAISPRPPFEVSGLVLSSGSITAGNLMAAGAAGPYDSFAGSGSPGGAGGTVTIGAGGNINTGFIRSFGGGGWGTFLENGLAGGAGGAIAVTSTGGAINIAGDVNASGGGGGGAGGSLLTPYVGGAGGSGANVTVSGTGTVNIIGPVLAAGGGSGGKTMDFFGHVSGGGGSFGGRGGTGGDTSGNGLGLGFADSIPNYGGGGGGFGLGGSGTSLVENGSDAGGASAGAVVINGRLVAIGTIGQLLTSTGGSFDLDSVNALGGGGTVILNSQFGQTTYFNDANYGALANVYLAPGSGRLQAGSGIGTPITVNGIASASPVNLGIFGAGGATIEESGSPFVILPGMFITPAEQIAYIQVAAGGPQALTLGGTGPGTGRAIGGSFSIQTENIPTGNFTNLRLPPTVVANANVSILTYTGSAQISGTLNLNNSTSQLNIGGSTSVLGLGSITFSNNSSGALTSGGSIDLSGPGIGLTVNSFSPSTLVLVSGGEIRSVAALLNLSQPNALDLTVIAGVNLSPIQADGSVSFSAGSTSGGAVQVNSSISTNGGKLEIAAYAGSALGSGSVNIAGTIDTNNGNLTIISGAASGTGISTGQIISAGTALTGSAGSVRLLTASPIIANPGAATIANSTISPSPVFATSGLTLSGAGISTGGILAAGAGGAGATASAGEAGGAGGEIQIQSGGSISVGFVRSFGGGGGGGSAGGTGGNGGNINITAVSGFILIAGDINSSGGGGGGSSQSDVPGGLGGSAGSITISTSSGVAITGPILAVGGGNGGYNDSGSTLSSDSGGGGGGGSFGGGGGGAAHTSSGAGGGGGFYGGGGAGGGTSSATVGGSGAGGGYAGGGGGGGGSTGTIAGSGGGGGGGLGNGGGGGGGGFFGGAGAGGEGGGVSAGNNGVNGSNTINGGTGAFGGSGNGGGGNGSSGQGASGDFIGGRGGNGDTTGGGTPNGGLGSNGGAGFGGRFGSGGTSGGLTSGTNGAEAGATGASGNSGAITISGQTISVSTDIGNLDGGSSGFSLSNYNADALNALGNNGTIVISAGAFAPIYLPDANYGLGANTYPAQTGGFFSTGGLAAGTGAGQPITIGGVSYASPVAGGSFGGETATILEDGVSVTIGPGMFITPAEQIAFVQVVLGGTPASQTLILSQSLSTSNPGTGYASGGDFNIDSNNIPDGGFTNLILPDLVIATVSVPLTYSGSASISGSLNFNSPGAQLNVGNGLTIAPTGIIGSVDSLSINLGTDTTFTNDGKVESLSLAAAGTNTISISSLGTWTLAGSTGILDPGQNHFAKLTSPISVILANSLTQEIGSAGITASIEIAAPRLYGPDDGSTASVNTSGTVVLHSGSAGGSFQAIGNGTINFGSPAGGLTNFSSATGGDLNFTIQDIVLEQTGTTGNSFVLNSGGTFRNSGTILVSADTITIAGTDLTLKGEFGIFSFNSTGSVRVEANVLRMDDINLSVSSGSDFVLSVAQVVGNFTTILNGPVVLDGVSSTRFSLAAGAAASIIRVDSLQDSSGFTTLTVDNGVTVTSDATITFGSASNYNVSGAISANGLISLPSDSQIVMGTGSALTAQSSNNIDFGTNTQISGGSLSGTITANQINFTGGTVNVDIREINGLLGPISTGGSDVTIHTAVGNLVVAQTGVDTSGGSNADGGTIDLRASTGSIRGVTLVTAPSFNTQGDGNGKSAGSISLIAGIDLSTATVQATGINGASGQAITLTAPNGLNLISDVDARGSVAGGNITINTEALSGTSAAVSTNFNATISVESQDNLILTGTTTFRTAGAGSTSFLAMTAGKSITLGDAAALVVEGGGDLNIRTPNLIFAATTTSPSLTATENSAVTINSGNSSTNVSLNITGAAGFGGTITTCANCAGSGGSILISPTGNGSLTFAISGVGVTDLSFNGADLALNATAVTINPGVFIGSDQQIVVNMNYAAPATPTFVNNGSLETQFSGANTSSILIQNTLGNLNLSGSGSFLQAGSVKGDTVFRSSGNLTIIDGTSFTASGGGSVIFYALEIQVSSPSAATASATFSANGVSNYVINSSFVCTICPLAFRPAGLATTSTLNLNGAPVATSTVGGATFNPVSSILVGADFTLATDSSITLSTTPFTPGTSSIVTLDGTVSALSGSVVVQNPDNLILVGTGRIETGPFGSINFNAGNMITLAGGVLPTTLTVAGGPLSVDAPQLVIASGQSLIRNNDISITTSSLTNNGSLQMLSPSNINVLAAQVGSSLDLTVNGSGSYSATYLNLTLDCLCSPSSANLTLSGSPTVDGSIAILTASIGSVVVPVNTNVTASDGISVSTNSLSIFGTLRALGSLPILGSGGINIADNGLSGSGTMSINGPGTLIAISDSIVFQPSSNSITFTNTLTLRASPVGSSAAVSVVDNANLGVILTANANLMVIGGDGRTLIESPTGLPLNLLGSGKLSSTTQLAITATAPASNLNLTGSPSLLLEGPVFLSATGGAVNIISGQIAHSGPVMLNTPAAIPSGFNPDTDVAQLNSTVTPPNSVNASLYIRTNELTVNGNLSAMTVAEAAAEIGTGSNFGTGLASLETGRLPIFSFLFSLFQQGDITNLSAPQIIATDKTPFRQSTSEETFLLGYLSSDQLEHPTGFIATLEDARLHTVSLFTQNWAENAGLVAGQQTGGNSLQLMQGAGIFTPAQDIVIQTNHGTVYIAAKSTAIIWTTGKETTIYTLHSKRLGDISALVGKHRISIPLGMQLVLANGDGKNLEGINAITGIAFRNAIDLNLDGEVKGFLADFSLMSSIEAIKVLRGLAKSGDPAAKRFVSILLKNSALLAHVTASHGPYKTSK